MKISFIIGTMSGGGAERVISVLANWFSKKGYDTSVIAIIEDNISYELDPNIKYYANQFNNFKRLKRVANRYSFTKRTLRDIQPDVVISFTTEINIYALIASLGLKSKVIISERNDPFRDPPSKITRSIRNVVYGLSDKYVFQTPDAKEYFSKKIQGKSVIIANPLKEKLPNRYEGIRKKEFVTVARLSKQKNLKMLIDAYEMIHSEYDDYKLRIYGEGPLRKEIEEYLIQKKLTEVVFLMGFEKEVHNKIIDARAFILSSDYEGISNAMLESLAIGLPTLCTDCPAGGAKMFIQHKVNGLLVPVGDVKKLYYAMKDIVENTELVETLSKNSILIKDELSVEKICLRWEEVIKKI